VIVLLYLSIGAAAIAVLVAEALRWPCGRCGRRYWPWIGSCRSCLGRSR
jgi:hypothetical protein